MQGTEREETEMKKYTAEIWVVADKDMPENEIRKGIQDAYNEYWSLSSGHFKVSRICNIKRCP